jgi:antitoxin MazE
MDTKLVVIGNSQGVRLPKAVVEEAGVALEQPLRIDVQGGRIVLTPISGVRQGWAEAASAAADRQDRLWGELPPAAHGDDDWTW